MQRMKTFAFSSIKGGVGKTSTVTLLAQYLAAIGKKVLLVDLDIQNSLTFQFRREFEETEVQNIARALTTGMTAANILPTEKDNVDILASHFNLTALRTINPRVLGKVLSKVQEEYDFCLIDTSPNFDNHVLSAWLAADLVISPTRLGLFEYKGLLFMLDQMVMELDDEWKTKWKIFFNFYRKPRSENSAEVEYKELFKETFADQLLPMALHESSLIRKAVDYGERITLAKSKQRIHHFFSQLAGEITGENLTEEVRF